MLRIDKQWYEEYIISIRSDEKKGERRYDVFELRGRSYHEKEQVVYNFKQRIPQRKRIESLENALNIELTHVKKWSEEVKVVPWLHLLLRSE